MDSRPSMTSDELLEAYFEGALSADEERQLQAWLESDPAHWDEFIDQLDVHASLWEECALSTEAEKERLGGEALPTRQKRARRTAPALRASAAFRRAGKRSPYFVGALAAAGALIALTALVLSTGGRSPMPRPDETVSRPQPPGPPAPPREPERKGPVELAPAPSSARPSQPPEPPTPRKPEAPPAPPEPAKEPPKPQAPPPVDPGRPEPPKSAPPPAPKTEASLAKIDRVEGEVFLLAKRGRVPAKGGEEILAGEGIETAGPKSLAVVSYPDRSHLEVGGESVLEEFSERQGKRVVLSRGTVAADVTKQPQDRPMVFGTPQGDATVLGTTLRLTVDSGDSGRTRLEVKEGRVRLTRSADKKAVDVVSGQFAVVAAGIDLAARPMRVSLGLQALYLFNEGQGVDVRDSSGTGAPLDLRVRKASLVSWRPTGLSIDGRTYVASPGPATKVVEACKKSREVTLELWIRPAKPAMDTFEGCIFALSKDNASRNLVFLHGDRAESLNLYAVWMRTTGTDGSGAPPLIGARGAVEVRMTHLVFTHAAAGTEKLYVDGVERAARARGGDLSAWNDSFRLCLGTEGPDVDDERPWLGEYRLVAVYSRALTADEVGRNHKSGTP